VRRSRRSHTCGSGCCQLASTTPPRHCDIDAHKVESSLSRKRRLAWSEHIAIRRLNVYCLQVGNNWETQPCGQGAGSAFDGFCADHTWHSLATHSLCAFTKKRDSADHRGYVRRCRGCQPGNYFHKTKKAATTGPSSMASQRWKARFLLHHVSACLGGLAGLMREASVVASVESPRLQVLGVGDLDDERLW
jgi:hypothetical protein